MRILFFILIISLTRVSFADVLHENWGQACSGKQIFEICNKFLINHFGQKWVKNYTPFYPSKGIIKKDGSQRFVMVSYSFVGPANLKHESFERNGGSWVDYGPTFYFELTRITQNGCAQLNLCGGSGVVAPYDPLTLITPEAASKIAKQKGFDVQFETLKLIQSKQMIGKLMLSVPGYEKDCGYETISVNAVDGSLTHQQRPIPG